jgi:hypothetical protein
MSSFCTSAGATPVPYAQYYSCIEPGRQLKKSFQSEKWGSGKMIREANIISYQFSIPFNIGALSNHISKIFFLQYQLAQFGIELE